MSYTHSAGIKGLSKGAAVRLISLSMFLLGVICSYQGALREIGWLGPLVVTLIVLIEVFRSKERTRPKIFVVLFVGITGFTMETVLIAMNVYSVAGSSRWILPTPLAPLWIVALWINYAVRVPALVTMLRRRHMFNFIKGFVFAALIFTSASNMALIQLTWGRLTIGIIGLLWGVFIITIYMFADRQLRT